MAAKEHSLMPTNNSDIILGSNGADYIDALGGSDQVLGYNQNDTLYGGSGSDNLFGGNGSDYLDGGDDADGVYGDNGNDTLVGGSGNDQLNGGTGVDTVVYIGSASNFRVTKNGAVQNFTGYGTFDINNAHTVVTDLDTSDGNDGTDQLTAIKYITFDPGADVTPPVVTLTALGTVGDTTPTISGTVDDATATVVVLLDGTSYTAVNNGDGSWVLDGASVSELEYDTYSITVTATDAASNAATASGSFVVEDQVPPVVTLTALGTVTDTTPTISGTVDDATATVVVQLDGASYTAVNNGDGTWVLDGAAITELGNGAYTATVTATDGAGNQDTASDSFVVDSDIVNGTSGNDLIRVGYVDTDGDVVGDSGTNVIEAASGDDKIFVGAATDTIRGQDGNDNIRAGGGNDVLSGGAGNDLLDGGTGADTMTGGAGNDAYFLDDAGDVISEDSNAGHDRVKSTVTHVLGTHFEELWLMGAGDLDGTGNEANNFMRGSDGDNTLSAQGGQDTILGRDGADVILAGAGDDMARGNQENDTLDGGAGNDKLYGDNGDDSLTGGEGDDRLYGGAGNDEQQGGAGNDRLNGGAGADTLTGGTGNDVYRIDENDVITEAADAGYDKVVLYSTGGTYNIAANIEKVAVKKADVQSETTVYGNDDGQVIIVRGSADVYAGDGDDHITLGHQMGQLGLANGGAGNDKLHGSLRADALHGGDGNDKLISGGNDSGTDETLAGGGGDDIIFCDTGVQRVVFYAGDDADIVKSFDAAEDMLCFGGGLAKADVTITETDRGQLFSYGDGDEVHVIGADLTINDLNFIV
jgi:Ca2+-binding RTX toxin-like protein